MDIATVRHSDLARAVVTITVGTAAAQLINAVSTPFVARLYGPELLGRFGVYTALLAILSVFTSLRYDLAIVSASTVTDAARLVALAVFVLIPASIASGAAMFLLIRWHLGGLDTLPAYAPLLITGTLILIGLYTISRYWLLREGAFRLVSLAQFGQALGRTVAQLLIGVTWGGWGGLPVGDSVGRSCGLARMLGRTYQEVSGHARPVSVRTLRDVARRYWKFPTYSLPSSLLDTIALWLPTPLLLHFFGAEATGFYTLASNLMAVPLLFVGNAIGDVFFSRVSLYAREVPHRVKPFFLRTTLVLLAAGTPAIALIVVAAGKGLPLLLGREWAGIGPIPVALGVGALAQLVVSPVSRIVVVIQAQEMKLVYDVSSLVMVLVSIKLGDDLSFSLFGTLLLLSASQAVAYFIYWMILVKQVGRWTSS